MSRTIEYPIGSAQALLSKISKRGTAFAWNVARTTESTSLNASIVQQVVLPNSQGLFIETYRLDPIDAPDVINVDHHRITISESTAFIKNLRFRGRGHHCPSLPSSLTCLPYLPR